MSDEYKNNFVVLTDEEGNEKEFEHIDTLEDGGTTINLFQQNMFAVRAEIEVGFRCDTTVFNKLTVTGT